MAKIPYKINLTENEMPKQWMNLRAFMPEKPDPMLHPGTLQPCVKADLTPVFCDALVDQELNKTDPFIDIPAGILDFYRMYRPSPLTRAYNLERELGTPAEIYYKFEGSNTSGSHKLNSAAAQVYYAKEQGLTSLTTETGAGQWGTALAMACAFYKVDLTVYMVKVSAEQKPYRKVLMETFGGKVVPSPSDTTAAGRKILAENPPGFGGSLGCAISEALETAMQKPNCRYVLGSVLDHVVMHQSVIGLETKAALDKYDIQPDVIIGCAGGGSNLGGLIAPFMAERLEGKNSIRFVAVEPGGATPMISATLPRPHRSCACIRLAASSGPRPTMPADCATMGCRRSCPSSITTGIWKRVRTGRRKCLTRRCSLPAARGRCPRPNRRTRSAARLTKRLNARGQARKRPLYSA